MKYLFPTLAITATLLPLTSHAFGNIKTNQFNQELSGSTSLFMTSKNVNEDNDNSLLGNILNPLNAVADMFQNMDDVVDDFFNKRMGNGEIFYGKRKYKPSGTVEGDYNGFGLSDFQKIEMTKERKNEWLEEQRWRKEMAELREEKER